MSEALSLIASSKHHVQQLAHRRGLGHLFDRLEVDRVVVAAGHLLQALVFLDLLDDVLNALVMAGVQPLDGRHHVGLGRDRPLDLGAQKHLQAVERRRVLRLRHRHRQALVFLVLRDRHDLVGGRHALVDQLGQLGRDRDVGQLDHLHPELLAQRLQDLVFLDQPHAHRDLAQQLGAGTLLLLDHLPEGFLVEVTHVDHDRAESSGHLSELSVVSGQWSVVSGPLPVIGLSDGQNSDASRVVSRDGPTILPPYEAGAGITPITECSACREPDTMRDPMQGVSSTADKTAMNSQAFIKQSIEAADDRSRPV